MRSEAVVQFVDVIVRETYPARLTLHVTGYQPDGCALPLQIEQRRERYGNRVFVDIYRLVDPAMTCPAVLFPLDEYIQLDGTFERGTYTIQVNDYVTQVSIPFPPPPPPPPPPDPYRSYAVVEYVEVLLGDKYMYPPGLTLHVTGYYSEGCQGQLQIEQYRQGYWVYVEIYQLVDPRVMCPEMLVRLDEYIPLDGVFEYGTYTIQVNDYTLQYTLPPVPIYDDLPPPVPYPDGEFQRYNAVIESVEVTVLESYPMQLHVRVTGYQEGGCDPSFQMAQRRAGNTVTVEIYRLVNPMVMCNAKPTPIDETIPLEGGFEGGEYTIRVNDYVFNITI
jgi:inhibitor of cysteine peptidase